MRLERDARVAERAEALVPEIDERRRLEAAWNPGRGLWGWLRTVSHRDIGRRYVATAFAFFVLAGLSSLGLPGLAGFVAEFLVFLGAFRSAHPWWVFPAVAGALITAVYVLRAVNRIYLGPPKEKFAELPDAHGVEWVTLVVLGGLLVVFGLYPRLLLDSIEGGVAEFLGRWGI